MHDVIVVGARCAGAPLAMLLARQGGGVLSIARQGPPAGCATGKSSTGSPRTRLLCRR